MDKQPARSRQTRNARGKILVADPDAIWRRGLRLLLEPSFPVVEEAGSGEEAISKAVESHPDVVVMDVQIPDANGNAAASRIKQQLPETEVIMTAGADGEQRFFESVRSDACGYVLKEDPPDTIIQAVQHAVISHDGKLAKGLTSSSSNSMIARNSSQSLSWKPLTGREMEVLSLIAEGKKVKEVARTLDISARTVDRHVLNIYCKLGASSRVQAVSTAVRRGILRI